MVIIAYSPVSNAIQWTYKNHFVGHVHHWFAQMNDGTANTTWVIFRALLLILLHVSFVQYTKIWSGTNLQPHTSVI